MRHRPPRGFALAVVGTVAALVTGGSAIMVAHARAVPETGPVAVPVQGPRPAQLPTPRADFNGDGYEDLALSAPGGTVDGLPGAGSVTVMYGSPAGASPEDRQLVDQSTREVPGHPSRDGGFGTTTVARDLDGDGRTDLVVGTGDGSAPLLLRGAKDGLRAGARLSGGATDGRAMAGGDFDGDGQDDLAVVPRGDGHGVRILYGPFRDGAPASSGTVGADRTRKPGQLVAGDVDGDGRDDLLALPDSATGASRLYPGSAKGLTDRATTLAPATTGTIADVDNDGHGDLVLGVPYGGATEGPDDRGRLRVLYGAADGVSDRSTLIDQNTPGIPGSAQQGDHFGFSLSSGDVNGDGYADIAVGVPHKTLGGDRTGTGVVIVLKGGAEGLTGAGALAFHQDTTEVPGTARAHDHFGHAVSLRDTDDDGRAELCVGAPGKDHRAARQAGAVWLLRGDPGGTSTEAVLSYGPADLGFPEDGASLGRSLAR
ncbi:FG-GAP-like repeat-containing protein [Streptomyces sp. NPDC005438]|uniref:FG-GAP-like repeat-containing protein n=1 Tax=Streptomyces sp. NPDC005438 TaxID=3156880 RepID=UPI0033A98A02